MDSVNNRTNGSLNAAEATSALRNALAGNGKLRWYRLSSLRWLNNSWACRRRIVSAAAASEGIARTVGAQYVLYSNATGNVNAPELKMQLMLVQTGEIIWSGKGAVSQQ